ncbi:MAG TPA: hypothetical protein VNZ22_17220 [Bacillota bacterium]|nr:hypothetical protein [Bacillota bacterium]
MSKLTKVIAVVLLAFWGLATSHCALEQVTGLEFLACCQHPDQAPHQDNDCEQDSCATIEAGFYKVEEASTSAPALPLLFTWTVQQWVVAPATYSIPQFTPASSAPPELPRLWLFHHRTALPPRAPSLRV